MTNITVTRIAKFPFATAVNFKGEDGTPYTANVPHDGKPTTVYAFGGEGDACTKTYKIDAPELVAAVESAVALNQGA